LSQVLVHPVLGALTSRDPRKSGVHHLSCLYHQCYGLPIHAVLSMQISLVAPFRLALNRMTNGADSGIGWDLIATSEWNQTWQGEM
jgi:hypothetical protein